MSLAEVELVDDTLEELAGLIRDEYQMSRDALASAIDHYFVCGAALLEARKLLPSTQAFGAWFDSRNFGFTTQWARVLSSAAEYEGAVRVAIASQLSIGKSPNLEKAVKQAVAALGGGRSERPALAAVAADATPTEDAPTAFATIVIDPPWRYGNTATRGAAEDHYPTMTFSELEALELPSLDASHLYLWTTNNFIGDALDLCVSWGFEYKTMLTWVKPQMGMGNYFRSVTEHVVFGTKGSLPTLRNDRTNVINADRTRHSAKPDAFYDLVQEMSPGPYLEMFARTRRMGWHTWGNEA